MSSASAGTRPFGLGTTDHVPVAPAVATDHDAIANDVARKNADLAKHHGSRYLTVTSWCIPSR